MQGIGEYFKAFNERPERLRAIMDRLMPRPWREELSDLCYDLLPPTKKQRLRFGMTPAEIVGVVRESLERLGYVTWANRALLDSLAADLEAQDRGVLDAAPPPG